ncbi:MAG: DRTGG domain-containing protein [Candidatus Bathyarchaeia archaeon]|nr:AAA family ATPase [Candidatus Bathyarchaeota archaeon]
MVYSIYVAGTSFSGKTALCLGLYGKFQEMGLRVGFFKPVGRGLKMIDGKLRDPDTFLMKEVMGLLNPLDEITPIIVGRRYLDEILQKCEYALGRIRESYEKMGRDKDILLIESAPQPEFLVSCGLDVSRFSKEFSSKVILTVRGEDDSVAERALLYKLMIEERGGKILGVVLNFIPHQQMERMKGIVSRVLSLCGLEVLGIVPDLRELTLPTVQEIVEALNAELLAGERNIEALVDDFLIGAMTPESAMSWLRRSVGRALITGGDRTDLILTALETRPSAIILTGNIYPSERVLTSAEEKGIPVLLVPDDTYTTVTKLEYLDGRIYLSPKSTRKIQLALKMIGEYIDMKRILEDYVSCKERRT